MAVEWETDAVERLGIRLPIVGAPPDRMTLPVAGSMICANDCTDPSAIRTPGTAWTEGRRRSGMGFSS